MKLPARGSLVWRLYALGLAQLVLLAAAVAVVGYLLREVLSPSGAGALPPPGLPLAPLLTFFASGALIVGVGAVLSWRWMARPLAHLSRAVRALGSGDLTARAGLARADELGELARGFDDMAARIEGLVLTQKELLANVSHELRTPLARIRVAVDLASEGDAAAAQSSLGEIAVDLEELERMVDDILTTTRMDLHRGAYKATGCAMRRADVAPASIALCAGERFRARYPERGLEVSVATGLPPIHVDAALFRRVLDNLLDNANKYSPRGAPIRLLVTSGGVIDAMKEGGACDRGAVVFEVVDRGMGISPPDLVRIFEPFFRAERSRSRGTGGVGLGLTLAKRIVDAHGARIEIESDSGAGTRARVSVTPSG